MFDIKPDNRMSTEEKLLFNIQELLLKITGLPQTEEQCGAAKPETPKKQARPKPRKKRTLKGVDKK